MPVRAWVVGLVVVLAGCRSGVTRTLHPPKEPLVVSSIVVYPVRLTGTKPLSWREFELAQRLVDAGLRAHGGRLAFFGPSEFQVSKWAEASWRASTVVPQLIRQGFKPDEAVVLRTTAERRTSSSAMERRDASDLAKGGVVTEDVQWLAQVEVLRPSTGEVLAEFSAEVKVDPFAPPTGDEEFDPDVALTRLVEKLGLEALGWAAKALPDGAPDVDPPPLTLAMTPAITTAHLDSGVATMDALTAEVWVQNRARFLTPSLPEAVVMAVARQPLGLYVVEAKDGAGVQAGDVILRVDKAPPLPQVLYRKRLRGVPVPVTVKRGGAQVDASIP